MKEHDYDVVFVLREIMDWTLMMDNLCNALSNTLSNTLSNALSIQYPVGQSRYPQSLRCIDSSAVVDAANAGVIAVAPMPTLVMVPGFARIYVLMW